MKEAIFALILFPSLFGGMYVANEYNKLDPNAYLRGISSPLSISDRGASASVNASRPFGYAASTATDRDVCLAARKARAVGMLSEAEFSSLAATCERLDAGEQRL